MGRKIDGESKAKSAIPLVAQTAHKAQVPENGAGRKAPQPSAPIPPTEPIQKELGVALKEMVQLLSMPRRVFLFGAGCSICAGLPAMGELTNKVIVAAEAASEPGVRERRQRILEGLRASFDGSATANIEDILSELVDLASIASRRVARGANNGKVSVGGHSYTDDELLAVLGEFKEMIHDALDDSSARVETHRRFARVIHRALQIGKAMDGRRVDYFTLNYDCLIETALGMEKIPYTDGFRGGSVGWWDEAEYARPGCEAKVFKIHGSIDWSLLKDEFFPRRLANPVPPEQVQERVLIWPAATKYREAQKDPFALMIERFRQALAPGYSESVVLAIIGYSFGDEHINHELTSALMKSQGRLQVIAFSGEATPPSMIARWCGHPEFGEQVRLYYRRGFQHGANSVPAVEDVDWWRFEKITDLLEGRG